MNHVVRIATVLSLLLCSTTVFAIDAPRIHRWDREVMETPTFQRHHPDLRWRMQGLAAFEDGEHEAALRHLRTAARYGDKVSQSVVAEMYWLGLGTAQDRPQAYAWMDLAAERGYPILLGKREQYWSELDGTERARAIEIGRAVYAEFGDDAALPRLHSTINVGKRGMTGSRLGNGGGVKVIYPDGPADGVVVGTLFGWGVSVMGGRHVHRMWDTRFWRPEKYIAWKEEVFDAEVSSIGTVEVSPLRAAGD